MFDGGDSFSSLIITLFAEPSLSPAVQELKLMPHQKRGRSSCSSDEQVPRKQQKVNPASDDEVPHTFDLPVPINVNNPLFTVTKHGMHTFQIGTVGKVNSKLISYDQRNRFVAGNNKSAVLYFLVNQVYPASTLVGTTIPVSMRGYAFDADFKVMAGDRSKNLPKDLKGKIAFLCKAWRVPDGICDISVCDDSTTSINDPFDGSWTSAPPVDREGRDNAAHPTDTEVLARTKLQIPPTPGTYAIAFYPLMGLTGRKGARGLKDRGKQCVALELPGPSSNVVLGSAYTVCSKDPDTKSQKKVEAESKLLDSFDFDLSM
jgi:hypothetical protein